MLGRLFSDRRSEVVKVCGTGKPAILYLYLYLYLYLSLSLSFFLSLSLSIYLAHSHFLGSTPAVRCQLYQLGR